jgi:hypothetical protein
VDYLVGEEGLPIKRACAYLGLARSSYYQRPASRAKVDDPVIKVLNQVVAKNGRWGFRLCFDWMRMHGYEWNWSCPYKTGHSAFATSRINSLGDFSLNPLWG